MLDLAMLSALQERLRLATGPSLELDNRIHAWLKGDTGFEWTGHYYNCDRGPSYGGDHEQGIAPVTKSVDAAIALVTRLLPGAYGHVAFGNIPEACLYYNHGEETISSFGATPALALLCALAKAQT